MYDMYDMYLNNNNIFLYMYLLAIRAKRVRAAIASISLLDTTYYVMRSFDMNANVTGFKNYASRVAFNVFGASYFIMILINMPTVRLRRLRVSSRTARMSASRGTAIAPDDVGHASIYPGWCHSAATLLHYLPRYILGQLFMYSIHHNP